MEETPERRDNIKSNFVKKNTQVQSNGINQSVYLNNPVKQEVSIMEY